MEIEIKAAAELMLASVRVGQMQQANDRMIQQCESIIEKLRRTREKNIQLLNQQHNDKRTV
jgi:hypothetical protein